MSDAARLASACQPRLLAWCISLVSLMLISLSGSALWFDRSATSNETQTRSAFLVVGLSVCAYPLARSVLPSERNAHDLIELLVFCAPAWLVVAESSLMFGVLLAAASFQATIASSLAFLTAPLLSAALHVVISKSDSEQGPGVRVDWLPMVLIAALALPCSWWQSTHALSVDATAAGSAAPTSSDGISNVIIGVLLAAIAHFKWLATRWAQERTAAAHSLVRLPAFVVTVHTTAQQTSRTVLGILSSSCVILLCLVLFALLLACSAPWSVDREVLFCQTTLAPQPSAQWSSDSSAGSIIGLSFLMFCGEWSVCIAVLYFLAAASFLFESSHPRSHRSPRPNEPLSIIISPRLPERYFVCDRTVRGPRRGHRRRIEREQCRRVRQRQDLCVGCILTLRRRP
jgi:hypothetical protein